MEVIPKYTDQSSVEKEKEKENHHVSTIYCTELASVELSMTKTEKSKVDELRALCQIQDPFSKKSFTSELLNLRRPQIKELDEPSFRANSYTATSSSLIKTDVDDFALRRFLRARDMDAQKASNMFLKYQKWRQSFMPEGSISESQVPNEIAQNKFFMQGLDKNGYPIVVLLAARHKQGNLNEFQRYAVYCLEKVFSRMPKDQEKVALIADLKGWGYSNCDIRGYLSALLLSQDYYPERIGKVYIVHAPYIFMAVWKIIYPFIDDNTKKKFVFVENENTKSGLLSEIDESQLPIQYGGKLPLKPIQDC